MKTAVTGVSTPKPTTFTAVPWMANVTCELEAPRFVKLIGEPGGVQTCPAAAGAAQEAALKTPGRTSVSVTVHVGAAAKASQLATLTVVPAGSVVLSSACRIAKVPPSTAKDPLEEGSTKKTPPPGLVVLLNVTVELAKTSAPEPLRTPAPTAAGRAARGAAAMIDNASSRETRRLASELIRCTPDGCAFPDLNVSKPNTGPGGLPGPKCGFATRAGVGHCPRMDTSPDDLLRDDAGVPVTLRRVGTIRSSLKTRAEAPRQGDEGAPDAWLELDPVLSAALQGVAAGDEVLVLTWFDRSRRDVLQVHPRGERSVALHGVFATRSPDRPNPIGLHRVTVREISGSRLRIGPIEALDGTPVVDLKPVLDNREA